MHQAPKLRFKVSIMCSIFLLCATQAAVMVWVWVCFIFWDTTYPKGGSCIRNAGRWHVHVCLSWSITVPSPSHSLPPSLHILCSSFFFSCLCKLSASSWRAKHPRDHCCAFLASGSVETNVIAVEKRDSVFRLLAEEDGTEQIRPDLLPVFL